MNLNITATIAMLIILTVILIIFIIKKQGMKKPSVSITAKKNKFSLASIFLATALTDEFFASLEQSLIKGDAGYDLTKNIITNLRNKIEEKKITTISAAKDELKSILVSCFSEKTFSIEGKTVLFIVGVNGVGKTTSIAKLANLLKKNHSIILAAADTFRAAAIEQLETWAKRADVQIVKGQQAGDPASVLFDALSKAKSNNTDIVIVDTAGRFHNQEHLIRQLEKMKRIATEKFPEYKFETLLALDANVGQNGLSQAEVFSKSLGVEGTIVAKLDGTAKGGVALSINYYLHLPVFFAGVGEKIEDFKKFSREEFVDSILN